MKAYYEQAGITIYNSRCEDVLTQLAGDVVITDPPYNVGMAYPSHDDNMPAAEYRAWLGSVFSLCAVAAPELVYFPGTRSLLDARDFLHGSMRPFRTLGWHRKEFAGDKSLGGPITCWEPIVWASRSERPKFNKRFGTSGRDFLVVDSTCGDPFYGPHPCPKPQKVLSWLVGLFVPDGGLVIDPFAGTSTTLRAAKDHGCRAVGIEVEERYCELAVKRLEQGVLFGVEAPQ